ncbi:MAG: succinylglutamate desuccinylase/aspartoacylase family protein [Desulfosarcinaceae bacterium]
MKRTSLVIGDTQVAPGSRKTIRLSVPPLYTHAAMSMPVTVIHGRQSGPRLFVCAAVHGDELVGVEIIRRLLKLKKLRRLRGTLMAVPVVNVYGFIQQSRYLPDRRDLNRFFPGSEKGSLTSQLADVFIDEVLSRATHGIDLHAGSNHRTNFPQIRADLREDETRRLALAFKAPVIIDAETRRKSLRQIAAEKGVPVLLYEAGEALRLHDVAIRAGVRGVLGVMGALQMLPRSATGRSKITPIETRRTTWLRAGSSGLFLSKVPLGARVREGQVLGQIVDPFGGVEEKIRSTQAGMVIGRLNLPLVHSGDAIFHLALFDQPTVIEPTISEFREEIDTFDPQAPQ